MNINFSDTDIIFMYGHFRKQARKLEELKATSNCSIDNKTINADISLYTSLADKLREACPNISKLDDYKI